MAFQSLSEEDIENIGYVVPVNVINHFLDDVDRHGKFSGVSGLGVKLQGMDVSSIFTSMTPALDAIRSTYCHSISDIWYNFMVFLFIRIRS